MPIFTVIRLAEKATIAEAIERNFAEDHYDLGHGTWLVASNGTAKELADQLGISDGTNGTGLVLEIASYFGRANPAIWTWIKSKWEGGPHG
jgi:hypothetical protein